MEWDMYADRFGFVTIPAGSLARIVSELTEDQARAAGSWVGANVWHSFLSFWQSGIDVKTFMKVFPSLVAKYSHLFEYEQREEGGRWTIVLRHNSGRAFSVYAAELVRSLTLEFLGTEPRVQASDGLVVIEIELLEARRQRRKMEPGRAEIDGRSDDIGHEITQ